MRIQDYRTITALVGMLWLTPAVHAGDIIYVDKNATGSGSDWCQAYEGLGVGIANANSGDEIRVADGTYKPGSLRTSSFQLKDGVTVKGGYAGCGAADEDARDIEIYETILSGEIGSSGTTTDNCYHVVDGSSVDASAVLDGFTITAGYADAQSAPNRDGGGMYINDTSKYPLIAEENISSIRELS
jgi:hypothetical protein